MGTMSADAWQQSFLDNGTPNPRRMVSEETAKAIDNEVKEIVETAHEQALDILKRNRDLLETLATKLLETEVIEGEELQHLLNQAKSVTQAPAILAEA